MRKLTFILQIQFVICIVIILYRVIQKKLSIAQFSFSNLTVGKLKLIANNSKITIKNNYELN